MAPMKATSLLPGAATVLAILGCFGMLAIAGVFAAFGIRLDAGVRAGAGTVCLFAVVATIGIAVNGRRSRMLGPLALAVAGTALVLADLYAGAGRLAEGAGFALLVLATLWDWRLRSRAAPALPEEVRWIETAELARRLGEARPPVILDVRDADEFAGELGHLDGARNIPLAELPARLAELGPDRNRPLALVCRTDMRSAKAARLLREEGFREIAVLRGGMLAWRQAEPPAAAAAPANAAQ